MATKDERPVALGVVPEAIPEELRNVPHWVDWRYEFREQLSKPWTKPPYQPNGYRASHSNPMTWSPFEACLRAYERTQTVDGVGFVLTKEDSYVATDIDHCRDPLDGHIEPWAREIIEHFSSYVEVSPSGTGIRIITKGKLPAGGRKRADLEVYDNVRYVTMTGHHLDGTPLTIESRQEELNTFLAGYFPVKEPAANRNGNSPKPVDLDDDEIIQKAKASKHGGRFQCLWDGDTSGHGGDWSRADLALANELAFWWGGDAEAMDRLFRQSGLMRDKWDEVHYGDGRTYGQHTIDVALEGATDYYTGVQHRNGHESSEYPQDDSEPEWEPRKELPSGRSSVPTLPPQMVPGPLRAWLVDGTARACMPLEMMAVPAITALGAVVGRSVGIRPGRYDDFLVVPNLWGAIIARPGAMKSYAIAEGIKPLNRLAATAHDRHQADEDVYDATRERISAEITTVKQEITRAVKVKREAFATSATPIVAGSGAETELNKPLVALEKELVDKNEELRQATDSEKRYITSDATTEKLGELLRDNPRGLMVSRDELIGWLRNLDKPGREGDRAFYLEAWNGTGGFTIDRIGRGTLHLESLTLSVCGGIQPGKLEPYIHGAIAGGDEADGLIQRIQLFVWPDSLGPWNPVARWPDTEAKNAAFEIYQKLDTLDPGSIGAECIDGEVPFLRFSYDAQLMADEWRDELENRLRSDELSNTPAFEAHLSKYRSLMPSLALLVHLVGIVDGQVSGPVGLESAQLAAAWCDFLEAHAKKIYAAELFPGVEAANTLADRIRSGAVVDGQSVREIYQHHWSGLSTPAEVAMALNVLKEVGWVYIETLDTGGRPAERLHLHPDLRLEYDD